MRPAVDIAFYQLIKAGFVNGHDAFFEILHTLFVHIQRSDAVTEIGKTCRGDQADVSHADDTNLFHIHFLFEISFWGFIVL